MNTPSVTSRPLPWTGLATWLLCALLLGPFLLYPVGRILVGALTENGALKPGLLLLPLQDPSVREAVRNSFGIGIAVTALATLIAFPCAYVTARLRFPGKSLLTGLLLVPLLLPPLVGAVGLSQMLAREGVVNTLLRQWGLRREPFEFLLASESGPLNDWLLARHWISEPVALLQPVVVMIVLTAAFHMYPLIYLNLAAAWANIDPTLEEAAENQGASGWHILRTVTVPLLLPGYLAGALIVFIFAFTDLGTPLIFSFREVAAVKIFDASSQPNNPLGYVLAFWLTLMAVAVFWISRRYLDGGRIATLSRAATAGRERDAAGWQLPLVYLGLLAVIGLALLPHIGVVLASFARDWTSTLWPDWTTKNYPRIFRDPTVPAASAIKISLLCAALSMTIDVVAGFFLAYALVRGRVWGRAFLDTLAMLPLALPGLVLAFGLLVSYIDTPWLNPTLNPIPLLVVSYAVRRLPYSLRAVSAGLQQMSVTLEEASLNLGASPLQTLWLVTRPLVTANLIAAGLLTFAFAVLEVSDSLILALNPARVPIAAAIYQLANQPGDTYLACALGVVGMALLTVTFLLANRLLGKQLGALFRA